MAEETTRFRLVKCPKCHNILTEFANIPVYKCGACGATLRAKHSIANVENDAVRSVEKVPENITSEDYSFEKQVNSQSSDLKYGILEARSPNLCTSDPNIENTRPDESSEHLKNDTETRGSDAKKENQDKKIRVEEGECLNSKVEKSLEIPRQGETSSRLSDRMNGSGHGKRSTRNDDCVVCAPKGHKGLSKSSFTHKEASDRRHRREKKAGEEDQRGISMNYVRQTSIQLLQKKILMKVDELRDELSDLFDKSAAEKIRSHSRLTKQENRGRQITTKYQPTINTQRRFRNTRDPISGHHLTNLYCQSGQFRSHPSDRAKERTQKPKEHLRPLFGGAPFVICHNCSKLLKLPTNLLVLGKQLHKVKCGSCSEVLKFSYRERTHSSPRRPNDVAHPNSEVSSTVDIGTGSDASNFHSLGISFSTEAEIPLHILRDSSSNLIDERKREGKQVIGSRLHLQINRTNDSFEEFETAKPTAPHLNRHVKERGAKDEKGKGILIDY